MKMNDVSMFDKDGGGSISKAELHGVLSIGNVVSIGAVDDILK